MKRVRISKVLRTLLLLAVFTMISAFAAQAAVAVPRITKVKAGETNVKLYWNKLKSVSGYNVYVRTDGEFVKLDTVVSKKAKSVNITGLTPNVEYKFKITAIKGTEESDFSNVMKATPKVVNPGKVSAYSGTTYETKAVVKWAKRAKATGYEVYQKDENGEYQLIATLGKKTKLTVKNLETGVKYAFRVRALRTVAGVTQYGALSKVVKITPNVKSKAVASVHGAYYSAVTESNVTANRVGDSGSVVIPKGASVVVIKKADKSIVKYKSKQYYVPLTSLKIKSFITNHKKAYSAATAAEYANYKHWTSPTKYLIWINVYTQNLYVFKKSGGSWKTIKSWVCSTGMYGINPFKLAEGKTEWMMTTPGKTKIRGHAAIWEFAPDQIAYYPSLIASGAIHSWLYYPGEPKKKWSGVGKLGTPSSHGCVRVDINNAKWIQESVPINTTVWVM